MTRAPRINVNMPALLLATDGHQTRVIIKDLSAEGFRIEHFDDLQPGDLVELHPDKGQALRARIQWSLGNEAGGLFLDPDPLPGDGSTNTN